MVSDSIRGLEQWIVIYVVSKQLVQKLQMR